MMTHSMYYLLISMYRLELTCNFKENGCTKIIKLEQLETHLNECIYQPNKIIQCPNGCEKIIERNEIKVRFEWILVFLKIYSFF